LLHPRAGPRLNRRTVRLQKVSFFAAHQVDEVLIVDPAARTVAWLGLRDGEYHPLERSGLIELGPAQLAGQLDWP
jgi:hypothetical protein